MSGRRPKAGPKSRKPGTGKRRRQPVRRLDPSDTDDAETRFVQPYQATKTYLCPGCNRDIPPGQGHMVVVPRGEPDLRRHWHRGCWVNRSSRR